jgi:hypothetical protein
VTAIRIAIVCAGAVAMSGTAHAQEERDEAVGVTATASATARAAEDGAFLSMTLAPRTGTTAAFAVAFGGYDSAAKSPRFDSVAEVHLWGPADLRGGATYSAAGDRMRPNVGLRVQLLRQEAHGLDGSVGVFYKAEGFTEPEGEIETILSAGARFGALSLVGNLAYGQDPEGNERDGEARAAVFRSWRAVSVGFDARARFALGVQRAAAAVREPRVDLAALPFASVVVGPVALFAQAGPSALRLANSDVVVGVTALGGVGAAF